MSLQSTPYIKPMLAFKFNPLKATYPLFIQPKYNGIRCLYHPTRKTFQSRDCHFWDPAILPHLLTELTGFKLPLDGELYCHGMSLQQINSRVAVKRVEPHDDVRSVKYYVFDLPMLEPMYRRALGLKKLEEMFKDCPSLVVAPTIQVNSPAECDYYYKSFKEQGYEGAMLRDPHAVYGFEHHCGNKENRWKYVLKRKETQDIDAVITQVYEGNGKYQGMLGAFELILENGVSFTAGSGLTDAQRQIYWEHRDALIGVNVKLEMEMFSDDGVPLKPIITYVDVLY
jgi:DNA ligase 1